MWKTGNGSKGSWYKLQFCTLPPPNYHQTTTKLPPNYQTTKLPPNYHQTTTKLPNYHQTTTKLPPNYYQTTTKLPPNYKQPSHYHSRKLLAIGFLSQISSHSFGEKLKGEPGRILHVIWCHRHTKTLPQNASIKTSSVATLTQKYETNTWEWD